MLEKQVLDSERLFYFGGYETLGEILEKIQVLLYFRYSVLHFNKKDVQMKLILRRYSLYKHKRV